MAKIIIIGAGLTGLSVAYHLEQNGFYDYLLFEKEADVGGLCRSVYQDGFTFDYTGHLLHINDDYVQSFIHKLVGFDTFHTIARRSYIYSHGVHTPYPFQVNLHGLPVQVISECIEGYIKRQRSSGKRISFIDWVHNEFGAGFAKHFFIPYQKKLFAHALQSVSASWTGRFVPKTSLQEIINGALYPPTEQSIGYNAHFLYPIQGGIQQWVHKVAEHIKQPIYTNTTVVEVNTHNKTVRLDNGHIEPFSYLINTIPLDALLQCLKEKSSGTLHKALTHLKCNRVINFNIGIQSDHLPKKHWIYYPEKQYPFYRIGFPSMLSAYMAPAGCSSLSGEFSFMHRSSRWISATLTHSIAQVKALFHIEDAQVITEKITPISHAYVLYDFWREKYLPRILAHLESESIYCAGRYAEWKYASMQEAILDGRDIVKKLLFKPAHKASTQEYTSLSHIKTYRPKDTQYESTQ